MYCLRAKGLGGTGLILGGSFTADRELSKKSIRYLKISGLSFTNVKQEPLFVFNSIVFGDFLLN